MDINLEHYTDVIGSGGFGMIVLNKSDNTVIKLIYSLTDCNVAKSEANTHVNFYKSLKKLNDESKQNLQIGTPKPISFVTKKIKFRGQDYGCAYIMSYLPFLQDYTLVHTIFKEDYENILNKKVGRRYTEPISDTNPSRGFFATISYIEKNILPQLPDKLKKNIKNGHNISFRVGILYGTCIFGAKVLPIDAEYVLSLMNDELTVTILDFGMFVPIDFTKSKEDIISQFEKARFDIEDIDLYFPYSYSDYYKDFVKGIMYSFDFFLRKERDPKVKDLMIVFAEKFAYSFISD